MVDNLQNRYDLFPLIVIHASISFGSFIDVPYRDPVGLPFDKRGSFCFSDFQAERLIHFCRELLPAPLKESQRRVMLL